MAESDAPEVRRGMVRAGVLVILGLVVEAFTLFWSHPTAFLVFACLGIGLVGLGISLYLATVLRSVQSVRDAGAEIAAES